jgi:hypothetical protein
VELDSEALKRRDEIGWRCYSLEKGEINTRNSARGSIAQRRLGKHAKTRQVVNRYWRLRADYGGGVSFNYDLLTSCFPQRRAVIGTVFETFAAAAAVGVGRNAQVRFRP